MLAPPMADRIPRKSPRRRAPERPSERGPAPTGARGHEQRSANGPRAQRNVVKVRSPHGTRVAMRIVCSGCGNADTIDFAPRDPKVVLCRRCAFERYGALDPDDSATRTKREKCSECGNGFDLVHSLKQAPPYVCGDCK